MIGWFSFHGRINPYIKMKTYLKKIIIHTDKRIDFVNITKLVQKAVDEFFGTLKLEINTEPGLIWWSKKW